jgi:hypothetical protein
MPYDPIEWPSRLKGIEREYFAARLATDRLIAEASHDMTVLGEFVKQRDLKQASSMLEATYIVRLFAEYETALRTYWSSNSTRRRRTLAKHLMDNIASKCRIGYDLLSHAQEVREYRNALVHERNRDMQEIAIAEVRGRLCRFLGRLH